MLKRTITYEDFNGETRTEDFYFNLTKAECAELEFGVDGGLSNMLTTLVNEKNLPNIIKIIKEFILKSYGIKSNDGKRFVKSKEISEDFSNTNAFSDLFMELAFDEDKFTEFIRAVIPEIPEEVMKKAKEEVDKIVSIDDNIES